MIADPTGPRAESVRALRTHIMAQHVREGRKALAICAASAGVGCTFVAANLAIALSQIGLSTLLIDADLRHPSMETLIPAPPRLAGLAQCLSSSDSQFSECIVSELLPNFSVMYAGAATSNPQELLAGDRFKSLIDFCLREFDVTIVDTPPANSCSDARRISTIVGYSLVVARRHKSFVKDVKTLSRELALDHSRVVGTVLNEA
jgi:capsular exopolysaccharide synthesis family protein